MKKKQLPPIAVVVINQNGRHFLNDCFTSLRRLTYPNYNVYLMDNHSSDDSIEYTKKNFPWVKILAFDKNYAFAEGYNRAAKSIHSEFLYFLNNDTKVTPDFLTEAIKPMFADTKIAACGSRMLFFDRPSYINYAGGKITSIGGGFEIGFNQKLLNGEPIPLETGVACGGAMLIRKSLFQRVGGFDPTYVIYFEDVDLCWRFWLYGYKVVYVPTSIVYHKYGGSFGGFNKSAKSVFLGQRNRLKNLFKNAGIVMLVKGLFFSAAYDTVKSVYYLIRGRIDSFLALHQGNAHFFFLEIRPALRMRKMIQKRRVLSDHSLRQRGVIAGVWESLRMFLHIMKK